MDFKRLFISFLLVLDLRLVSLLHILTKMPMSVNVRKGLILGFSVHYVEAQFGHTRLQPFVPLRGFDDDR